MMRRLVFAVTAAILAAAGAAWALSDADTGALWIQAASPRKIQVTNILSRDLGMDPAKLQQCLEKTFADPANVSKVIRDVAKQCKAQQP